MITKHISYDKNASISEINSIINVVNFSAYADISFKNNTDKKIVAVKFNTRGYNLFEETVFINNSFMFDITLENLSVEPLAYSAPIRVLMPDNTIVKIELSEHEIYFSDGSSSLYKGKNIIDYEVLSFEINNKDDIDIINALSCFSKQIKNYPIEVGKDWVCCCETYNTSLTCRNCKKDKIQVFKTVNFSNACKIIEENEKTRF